jgi:hypothetical protein
MGLMAHWQLKTEAAILIYDTNPWIFHYVIISECKFNLTQELYSAVSRACIVVLSLRYLIEF